MALFKTESRIQIVGFLFLLGISALIGRLWWVQVIRSDFYKQKIRGSGQVTVRIPSVRGEIRDKNGIALVRNRPSFSVDFLLDDMVKGYGQAFGRANVPKLRHVYTVAGVYKEANEPDVARIVRETVLPRLQQLGLKEDISDKQLQKHYRTDTLVPFTYMEDIDFADMAKLTEHDLGLPGVDVPSLRAVREYPYGALAAHVLGYVGAEKDVDEEEAKKFIYYQADVDGKNNIEQSMNKWLSGQSGTRFVKKNAKGVIEGDDHIQPPVTGDDVYLTIDARIQTIVENAMRVVGRGAAVVVDPANGNVLAMASVPSFDPNTFIPSISSEDWTTLIKDETNPLTNRAILSYAPGSTFKTITGFAGLIMGKGNNKYTCSGGVTYGGKYMHCWIGQKGGSHGTLDLEGGLKNSCNAYFFQYGNAAGVDAIDKVATSLGIGQKTGIELSNEAAGILPGKEWFSIHAPRERWSDGHTANLSIGQGYVQASPLQMALVGATIANGGTCYYPRLIDRVVDHNGQDVVDPETGKLVAGGPRIRSNLADLGLKPDQIEHIRHGMWRVVNEQGGTATKAKLKNIEIAGKTGTAEFWRNGVKDNHTWFMSFAPYKEPKIAVVVFIQGAKGGAVTAAPIASKIIEETLALEDGKKQVEVKSLEPAQGSFTFINNIDFSSGSAVVQTAANSEAATAGHLSTHTVADATEETPIADSETDAPADAAERNSDHDKVAAAAPKVREKTDKSEKSDNSSRQASPSTAANDTPLMKSMRKFFRRDSSGEGGDDDQDLKSQQKTLRKQQKAQEKKQQAASSQPPPPSQPQEPPKRKKFLGIF